MSTRPFYHVYRLQEFSTAEEALADAKLHQEILACLAEKFHVTVRRAPTYEQDREFEADIVRHYSMARYSVTNSYVNHPIGTILADDSSARAWQEEFGA